MCVVSFASIRSYRRHHGPIDGRACRMQDEKVCRDVHRSATTSASQQGTAMTLDSVVSSGAATRTPERARDLGRDGAETALVDDDAMRAVCATGWDAAAALIFGANVHIHAGQFAAASALVEAADAINEAAGNASDTYTALVIAAWRGHEERALELIDLNVRSATARGEGRAITLAEYARAVLCNGLGRYQAALVAARRACEREDARWLAWALAELVEAGARSDRPDVAAAAMRQLEERTCTVGTDSARAMEARSRAMLTGGADAEALYQEAIERLSRGSLAIHLARAHLVYGEWLRRESRRVDAREQLRTALVRFDDMGMAGFAERARRELLATGETVRKRSVETRDELTAQEAEIVRLARAGRTNPEIGTELFISPRTVEWHMRKVFTKLGVRSRRELREAL
jgi:DNA-binding CsgD family transcriptional regulator